MIKQAKLSYDNNGSVIDRTSNSEPVITSILYKLNVITISDHTTQNNIALPGFCAVKKSVRDVPACCSLLVGEDPS